MNRTRILSIGMIALGAITQLAGAPTKVVEGLWLLGLILLLLSWDTSEKSNRSIH